MPEAVRKGRGLWIAIAVLIAITLTPALLSFAGMRVLRRKEKALAETAALLVLRKKVNALWGDADDDTDERNGS